LGRKLLDLHKLYKKVTELGGYDKITEQKGEFEVVLMRIVFAVFISTRLLRSLGSLWSFVHTELVGRGRSRRSLVRRATTNFRRASLTSQLQEFGETSPTPTSHPSTTATRGIC
jgi:hypothetical protein